MSDILQMIMGGAGSIGSSLGGLGDAALSGIESIPGNIFNNITSMPTNLRTNLGTLVGGDDINRTIAAGGKTPGGFNATTGKMGAPGNNQRKMMAMMLQGLGGLGGGGMGGMGMGGMGLGGIGGGPLGMGVGAGGMDLQQMIPLLLLLQKLQGGGGGGGDTTGGGALA